LLRFGIIDPFNSSICRKTWQNCREIACVKENQKKDIAFGPILSEALSAQGTPSRACRRKPVFFDTLEAIVATGTVKWFNPTKGYGFIQPTGGGPDVFVHISAVERAGLSTLNENQQIEYEIVSNRGKSSAENLKVK
jgi:CspA family cold shock protein